MINLTDLTAQNNLVINASLNNLSFSDVHVKTLYSHYKESIEELAYSRFSKLLNDVHTNQERIDRRVNEIVENQSQTPVYLKQFIDVPTDTTLPITVCINVDRVDNNTWSDIISLLSKQELLVGKTEFGEPIAFGNNERHSDLTLNNIKLNTFI